MQSPAVLTHTFNAYSNTSFCESLADEIFQSHSWLSSPAPSAPSDARITSSKLPALTIPSTRVGSISLVNITMSPDNRFDVSPDAPDMKGGIPWVRLVENRRSMSRTMSFSAVNRLRQAESNIRNRKEIEPVKTLDLCDPEALLSLVEENNQRQSQKLAAIVESQTGRRKKCLFAFSLQPLTVIVSRLFASWERVVSQNQAISTYIAGFKTS